MELSGLQAVPVIREEQQKLIVYSLPETQSVDILRSIESFFSLHRVLISSLLLVVNSVLGVFLAVIFQYIWPATTLTAVWAATGVLAGSTAFAALGIWLIMRCSAPVYYVYNCQKCNHRGVMGTMTMARRSDMAPGRAQ